MVVLVEAVEAVDTLQELVFLVKETLVEMVETGAVAEAEAAQEPLGAMQPDLMVVPEELEFSLQSLELLYTMPEVAVEAETEEVTELEVTVAEVLGQVHQMELMEPEAVVLVSPQVQILEAQEATV
tara:strand:+ start:157 stop:534 length:378 start_codon:yes stop_codon:yes gene_type:complete